MRHIDWRRDTTPDGRAILAVAREIARAQGPTIAAAELSRLCARHFSCNQVDTALRNHGREEIPAASSTPTALEKAQGDRGGGEQSSPAGASPGAVLAGRGAPNAVEAAAAPAGAVWGDPIPANGPPTFHGPAFDPLPAEPDAILREENRELIAEVTRLRKGALTEERVRRELLRLAEAPRRVPDWLVDRSLSPEGSYGVPTLFSSDQHLGEVVDPAQIGGVNSYDLAIARRRWRHVTERAIELCFNFLARPRFDGVVAAFGGDGLSGDIHEELCATNERETLPLCLEYADLIVWTVRELKRAFGRVFVPAVIGNHPRLTHKPRAKGSAFTNLDWLAYQIASREFRGDPDVTFQIPDGTDAHWSVLGHRYAMTHGNQFRAGDSIIGPIGPVARGDQKKRARDSQVGQGYDTLLVAHFHQLRADARVIMNGSLKGYDEYAAQNNFGFEPPRQALFLTHATHWITFSMPVLAEEPAARAEPGAWAAAA